MVNSKGNLLTLTRLSVQSSPQLLMQLFSQLSAARCTGKQVLRFYISLGSSFLQFLSTSSVVSYSSSLIHILLSSLSSRSVHLASLLQGVLNVSNYFLFVCCSICTAISQSSMVCRHFPCSIVVPGQQEQLACSCTWGTAVPWMMLSTILYWTSGGS